MVDPKPAAVSRRRLLTGTLAGGAAIAGGGVLSGCSTRQDVRRRDTADPWRQFAGCTLNFVSENTAPTSAIAADAQRFTELTGIHINIVTLELSALVQKVALDLASGQSQYQVLYADSYQVLAPYAEGLVDLREPAGDPSLPGDTSRFDEFVPLQMDVSGRFGDGERVLALPYDCATMIWQYRKDLFETYHDRMAADLGFDPTPGPQRTWEEYFRIAKWFNDNVDEVAYGTGHQAKQHDSLMCDFSNVLFAHGGQYFPDGERVGRYGAVDPGPCQLDSDAALEAAEFYRRLLSVADPASRTWDWTGVGAAFAAGRVAMCPNWHEFAADNERALPGKVGYAALPSGPVKSANMYGGAGIAVNGNTAPNERKAAWLFLNWATSRRTQLRNLTGEVGGATPTLSSIYQLPEVRGAQQRPTDMPTMLTAPAVRRAWQPEYSGMRPKIPMWSECDTAIYTELSRMLAGDATSAQAMRDTTEQVDRIVSRGWVAAR
ncbi:multiple sugar transport system substrate-binding protein [Actinopolyspora lacussalsi]|nr:multiple sugar transport system substrate-binding protein [Actinopolyspora lacussalsi]